MRKTLLFLILAIFSLNTLKAQVPASEKNALIAFYNSTAGSSWTDNTNWNTVQPVSSWFGITVENIGGQDYVTKIEINAFSGNNLNGTLPVQIGSFPELKVLEISHNALLTGVIPTEIGNLTKLTTLSFWDDDFTGVIPASLGNCTQLSVLSLEDNQLTGNIPSSFSNLTAMTSFWINGNVLSGVLPNIFSTWSALDFFSIGNGNGTAGAHNNFTGDLDLSTNTNLRLCWVDNTLISSLNIRNGNNTNTSNSYFNTTNCPNLTCVFVDDATASTTNWTNIDATATFVETQTACDALYVSENTFDEAITIYPNPSSSILNIDYIGNSPIIKINIVNTLGQKVKASCFNNSVDITALKQGVYILKLENESGKTASFRFVKK